MIKIVTLFYFYIFIFIAHTNANEIIDIIIVDKSLRTLQIIQNGTIIKTFSIDLGFDPIGHKHFKGDSKTPEGLYYISKKSKKSDFHLSLQISYPNKWDQRNARNFNRNAGDYIMIHGEPNKKSRTEKKDWTNGCIALSNKDIEKLYKLVLYETPIYIKK
jgi:murein L,D-transpeptidase YafK